MKIDINRLRGNFIIKCSRFSSKTRSLGLITQILGPICYDGTEHVALVHNKHISWDVKTADMKYHITMAKIRECH